MGFDPSGALETLAGGVVGDPQLGGIAPIGGAVSGLGQAPQSQPLGLLSKLGQSNAPQLPIGDAIVNDDPSGLLGEDNPALKALRETPLPEENKSGIGGFFGNLDDTLSSPSQTLGIGLLGQLDPRLALLGLGAGGLLGNNKVFGG